MMKRVIISLALSTPLFLTALPGYSVTTSALENSVSRSDGVPGVNVSENVIKSGTNYAYWHRGHRGYRGYHWHRGYGYHHRHYWHHWRYW